jgi:hypothetical protein
MHHMKVIKYVWPAINRFSGTISPNSAKNALQLLFLIHKFQNVFAHWTTRTNTTVDALNVKSQTFGIQKPNSANGVLKVLCIKK